MASAAPGIGSSANHTTPSRSSAQPILASLTDCGTWPASTPSPASATTSTGSHLDRVIAPPYDVIDAAGRAELAGRDPHNAVLIDLPDEAEGDDRYAISQALLEAWRADGTLVTDERPSFTVYRMVAIDDAGVERRTTGVIGALELSPPGTDILPHEHTTKKAKSDRLDLLRSSRCNLSAIWGLSLAKGLTDLLPGRRAGRWPTSPTTTACATPSGGSTTPPPARPSPTPWRSTRSWWPTATTATRPRWPTRASARPPTGWRGRPAPRWPTWSSWSRTS